MATTAHERMPATAALRACSPCPALTSWACWCVSSGMETSELVAASDSANATLKMATLAYLACFKGQSRVHAESDLRAFTSWCQSRDLDPLEARRSPIELYLRWMQEVARYKPSTVSSPPPVLIGFYRNLVLHPGLPSPPPPSDLNPPSH